MTEVLNPKTAEQPSLEKPMPRPVLQAAKVLRPVCAFPHWQSHSSMSIGGADVNIYSMLGEGEPYSNAALSFSLARKGFRAEVGLTPQQAEQLCADLSKGVAKVRQIQAMGCPSEVSDVNDWYLSEQTTGRFVDAKTGGVAYRVFANQLDHLSTPEVQLMTYCHYGFAEGSEGLPGFLTPDAADELADALKAAAYQARMLTAQQKAQGGAA